MERTAAEVLPDTVRPDYGGISREFRDSSGSLYFIFVLALCFIYLVLAAQFERFVDPLIIMGTVPLSMTGALLALQLTELGRASCRDRVFQYVKGSGFAVTLQK